VAGEVAVLLVEPRDVDERLDEPLTTRRRVALELRLELVLDLLEPLLGEVAEDRLFLWEVVEERPFATSAFSVIASIVK